MFLRVIFIGGLMLIGFYVSTTTYIIPYNALLPELARDSASPVCRSEMNMQSGSGLNP